MNTAYLELFNRNVLFALRYFSPTLALWKRKFTFLLPFFFSKLGWMASGMAKCHLLLFLIS